MKRKIAPKNIKFNANNSEDINDFLNFDPSFTFVPSPVKEKEKKIIVYNKDNKKKNKGSLF